MKLSFRLWWVFAVLLIFFSSSRQRHHVSGLASSSSSSRPKNIEYRSGTVSDAFPIAVQLAKELMNPLGVNAERFLIASSSENPRIGWAQIRPLPIESQIQQETDEVMWDAFEENNKVQVPVGLKSLPWTQEYRDFAEQAARRTARETALRETRKETPRLYELASVWVDPRYRHQGIGTELVKRILQRHCREKGAATSIYLLTLSSTSKWYRDNFGFRLVTNDDEIPGQMAFEVKAGKLITGIIGAELVCMQGTEKTGKL